MGKEIESDEETSKNNYLFLVQLKSHTNQNLNINSRENGTIFEKFMEEILIKILAVLPTAFINHALSRKDAHHNSKIENPLLEINFCIAIAIALNKLGFDFLYDAHYSLFHQKRPDFIIEKDKVFYLEIKSGFNSNQIEEEAKM